MRPPRELTLALLFCASTAGCLTPQADHVPTAHVVMFDGDGDPVDPTSRPFLNLFPYRKMTTDGFETHLDLLFDSVERYVEEQQFSVYEELPGNAKKKKGRVDYEFDPREDGRPARVLLYIHGGLNQQKGTIDRAANLYDDILKDDHDRAYPVFVNWQSNLVSSYTTHLLFVRQGHDWGWWGALVSPFVLARDIAVAIANTPFTLYSEVDSFLKGLPYYTSPDQAQAYEAAATLEKRNRRSSDVTTDGEVLAEFVQDPRESNQGLGSFARLVVTLPVKLATATLLDVFGRGAWDVMVRRIDLLFERQDQYDSGLVQPRPAEGLPRFLERLAAYQAERERAGKPFQVDLVAHSMGTIVANRILDLRMRDAQRAPRITDIAYMASASTIQDFQSSVFPYLATNADSRLFLLTLHDKAEVTESHVLGLIPAGSLLVWIDNFLAKIRSHADFRIGRFTPLMLSLHRIESNLRDRIFIKSFSVDSADPTMDPNEHSDFNSAPFWRESFWKPAAPSAPAR